MKKSILLMLIITLVFCGQAFAETNWHTANQTTVAWDQDLSGIPAAEVKWNIYLANAATDPQKANPVKIGTATAKEYTVTLNTEGRFFVGVAAFRTVDGTDLESDIAWSDQATPAFGIQYFLVPLKPSGLILK